VLVASRFWQGVQVNKSSHRQPVCLHGASEQDASEGFLFPILSLVMGTALYVYHSILP
jgi:hypothetical protein